MKKLVLIVIDGLTPAMLERSVESEDVPALRFLMSRGKSKAEAQRIAAQHR